MTSEAKMAAFCGCCGAEITTKAEVCVVCGTPRHGMLPALTPAPLELDGETIPDDSQRLTRCCAPLPSARQK
jgi:hypothetical protein